MKPKIPNACPHCGRRNLTLARLTSRIYATWVCELCGQEWTADAATGRLIGRGGIKTIEGTAT